MAFNVRHKLDEKDKKILFELDHNARHSNSAIARMVGLSKQGVDYRIKRLVKEGVVEGFYPVINLMRLGYFFGRVFLKFHNLTADKVQEIHANVTKDKSIIWAVSCEGNYELIIATWTKSLAEFKAICNDIVERFGHYVNDKKESIGVKVAHLQSRYLLPVEAKSAAEFSFEEGPHVDVDAADKVLLKALCADTRAPLVSIANIAKASAKSTAYRLRALEGKGLILGYRPKINHNLLGFTHYKILFHLTELARNDIVRFKNSMKLLPEVVYIVDEIGMCDVDVEVMLPTAQSLFGFIDDIKFKFPTFIRDYELLMIKKTLKIGYLPF